MKIVAGEGKKSEIMGGTGEEVQGRAVLEKGVSWVFVGTEGGFRAIPTLAKHRNWPKTLKHQFWSIWQKNVGLARVRLAKLGFVQTWPKLVGPNLVLANVGWFWPNLV